MNSIDNFARSWQRAACFPEVLPRRSSLAPFESEDDFAVRSSGDESPAQPFDVEGELARPLLDGDIEEDAGRSPRKGFPSAGVLGSSHDRSFGTSYGTISTRMSDASRIHAIELHREHQTQPVTDGDFEGQHLLVKQVENQEGMRENVVVGQSTVPQTICNSVNVLIGVGLLSLPLAMKHAGWLVGMILLLYAALTTSYTARILAKCLDVDTSLVTYADLAYVSFGHHARLVTSLLFCLEIMAACVALVVLFADSLHALIPELSILQWKAICGIILIPLNFLPLRLLSVTSILGILACTSSTYRRDDEVC